MGTEISLNLGDLSLMTLELLNFGFQSVDSAQEDYAFFVEQHADALERGDLHSAEAFKKTVAQWIAGHREAIEKILPKFGSRWVGVDRFESRPLAEPSRSRLCERSNQDAVFAQVARFAEKKGGIQLSEGGTSPPADSPAAPPRKERSEAPFDPFKLARDFIRRGNYRKALYELEMWIDSRDVRRIRALHVAGLIGLSLCSRKLKDYEGALKSARLALKLAEKHHQRMEAQTEVVRSLGKINRIDALRLTDQLLAGEGSLSGMVWRLKAELLRNEGKWDEALAAIREAVRLYPNSATSIAEEGWILWHKGERERGLATLERAIVLYSSKARFYVWKAKILFNPEDQAQASRTVLKEAIARGKREKFPLAELYELYEALLLQLRGLGLSEEFLEVERQAEEDEIPDYRLEEILG